MTKAASYISAAYSFLYNLQQDQLLDVGYKEKNGNPIPSFDENILIDLCKEAQEVFKKEENVLEIYGDTIIIGDIHGSLHDLLRILKYIDENQSKVLFLGDYVDRGCFSLECITIILALKITKPDIFYLIRGNHEFDYACKQYGFKNEIVSSHYNNTNELTNQKVDDINHNISDNQINDNYQQYYFNKNCYQYTEKLYSEFIETFAYMPISAIINNTTFCIHGGLSPRLKKINGIKTLINRPIYTYEENPLLSDLLWSDPSTSRSVSFIENQRGSGYSFNISAVNKFLSSNSMKRMIRAHQCVQNGLKAHFDYLCLTVFSASNYDKELSNCCGLLKITQKDDLIQYIKFPPIPRLRKEETVYFKVQPFNLNEPLKCHCFSMRHPVVVFKGNTSKFSQSYSQGKCCIKSSKSVRDSQGLKINCHVNPASVAHFRKSVSQFIHIPTINESISLNCIDMEAQNQNKNISKSWSMKSKKPMPLEFD